MLTTVNNTRIVCEPRITASIGVCTRLQQQENWNYTDGVLCGQYFIEHTPFPHPATTTAVVLVLLRLREGNAGVAIFALCLLCFFLSVLLMPCPSSSSS